MATVRESVRKTILALVVSYLRDSDTTCAKFAAYPKSQNLWSFTLGGFLYHVAVAEAGQFTVVPGVTIEFAIDRAKATRAMPQAWEVDIRFRVRVPWSHSFPAGAGAFQIAAKIDEALQRVGERIEIKDYAAIPPTAFGHYVEWQTQSRGEWREQGDALLSDLVLEMTAEYTTPGL